MDKWASPIGRSIAFGYFVFHTKNGGDKNQSLPFVHLHSEILNFLHLQYLTYQTYPCTPLTCNDCIPCTILHFLHLLRCSTQTHPAPLSWLGSSQHCAWYHHVQPRTVAPTPGSWSCNWRAIFCWDKIKVFVGQTSFHLCVIPTFKKSLNISLKHIVMEMIPPTVGTQDFRLIWNEQNSPIWTSIKPWLDPGRIKSFTKWNPKTSMATFNLGSYWILRMAWPKLKEPAQHVQCPPTIWKCHLAKLQSNQEFVPFQAACMEFVPLKHPWRICIKSSISECHSMFFHTHDSLDVEVLVVLLAKWG